MENEKAVNREDLDELFGFVADVLTGMTLAFTTVIRQLHPDFDERTTAAVLQILLEKGALPNPDNEGQQWGLKLVQASLSLEPGQEPPRPHLRLVR